MLESIEKELREWFVGSQKIVIAGIGNPIRQDDYVGLKIVEGLHGNVSKNVLLLECETVPESYLSDIEEFKPTHVLLIDAAFLGLKPAEASLVEVHPAGAGGAIGIGLDSQRAAQQGALGIAQPQVTLVAGIGFQYQRAIFRVKTGIP